MSPATRYRFAAFTFAALGLLIALVASPAAAQSDRSGELQQLVNDLGYQLELVEQFDRRAAEQRRQQLAIALDRWNTSTRNQADFSRMQAWLQAAIQSSLPGSSDAMPKLPWFDERLARTEPAVAADVQTPAIPPQPSVETSEPTTTPESATVRRPSMPEPTFVNEPATIAVPKTTSAVAQAWQRHPAARPIDLGDPFADDPPIGSRTTARVAMRPKSVPAQAASSKVSINVAELGARVRGYVHGLRGVEARLLATPDMTSEELLLAARELRQLASQREFVTMYLEALSEADRARTAELPSAEHATALVTKRMQELQGAGEITAPAVETVEQLLKGV